MEVVPLLPLDPVSSSPKFGLPPYTMSPVSFDLENDFDDGVMELVP